MAGRRREICQGINVDLGTAAELRNQWKREAGKVRTSGGVKRRRLLLKTDQCVGDAVVLTAAIYSLHRTYPCKYLTAVKSKYPEVFHHNPDVVLAESISDAEEVQLHYSAIHESNQRSIHFMQAYCEFLENVLNVDIPLITNRPHIYFQYNPVVPWTDVIGKKGKPVWLICSGGKNYFTNKLWGQENYQQVVDLLKDEICFLQVGGNHKDHPLLNGVNNLIGTTTLRELFNIARIAEGVVCGVSLLMHVAAALEKPAIVIAGGREPVAWNAYPNQQYLHTVGALPCTTPQGDNGACWRSRTIPLGDNEFLDSDTCQFPINSTPKCMTLISPYSVAQKVLMYNRGNR